MIKIGNLLDNYNLDYSRVENDKTLSQPRHCSGCTKHINPFSKILSLQHNDLTFIICLSCADLISKNIDKLPNHIDGEFCLYCKNFSPMAQKNFPQGLICWSCNTHRNRVILGLE